MLPAGSLTQAAKQTQTAYAALISLGGGEFLSFPHADRGAASHGNGPARKQADPTAEREEVAERPDIKRWR